MVSKAWLRSVSAVAAVDDALSVTCQSDQNALNFESSNETLDFILGVKQISEHVELP